jgi:hypothetical protein
MMAKEKTKTDYLEIPEAMEIDGFKVKALFTANTNVSYDFDKKKHIIIKKNGRKYIVVNCDYVLIELE